MLDYTDVVHPTDPLSVHSVFQSIPRCLYMIRHSMCIAVVTKPKKALSVLHHCMQVKTCIHSVSVPGDPDPTQTAAVLIMSPCYSRELMYFLFFYSTNRATFAS